MIVFLLTDFSYFHWDRRKIDDRGIHSSFNVYVMSRHEIYLFFFLTRDLFLSNPRRFVILRLRNLLLLFLSIFLFLLIVLLLFLNMFKKLQNL